MVIAANNLAIVTILQEKNNIKSYLFFFKVSLLLVFHNEFCSKKENRYFVKLYKKYIYIRVIRQVGIIQFT